MEQLELFSLEVDPDTVHRRILQRSFFKIDADALTEEDIDNLAFLIKDNIEPFGWVEGVPTGGLRLAEALKPFITPNDPIGLIVDDVMTTGRSMNELKGERKAMGVVIFNRIPIGEPYPGWITSIWRFGL